MGEIGKTPILNDQADPRLWFGTTRSQVRILSPRLDKTSTLAIAPSAAEKSPDSKPDSNRREGSIVAMRPDHQPGEDGSTPIPSLRRSEWRVLPCDLSTAQELVRREHYSGGGSNTAVYTFGVFPSRQWFGTHPIAVAWYLPPTPACGKSVWPKDCQAVLSLSRLVCEPGAPKNTPSFLLSHGMRFIDRQRWPILITFADEWQGHLGTIYLAAGWIECGRTKPESTYTLNGRMVCRKAGPVTRTHEQMLELGCKFMGRFSRRRFVHVRPDLLNEFAPILHRLRTNSEKSPSSRKAVPA